MGHPFLKWNEIPLSEDVNTLKLPIEGLPTATGMGNPHCTFFVDDIEKFDIEYFGKTYENQRKGKGHLGEMRKNKGAPSSNWENLGKTTKI